MFSKRDLIVVMLSIIIITVCWLIGHSLKKSEEASTAIETTTVTEKVAEIATESVTEHDINDYTGARFSGMQLTKNTPYQITNNHLTKENALVYFRNHKETWYSVVQPHGYTTTYDIPGKHVADDGTIRDKDGYVCIASHTLPKGYTLLTSVGPGKVYDEWGSTMTIGIYTDWR